MVNIETLENKVKKLNAELEHFRNIESNEKSINEMKECIEEMKEQVEICEELVDEFEPRIETLEKSEVVIKEDIKSVNDKISNLKEQTDNKINSLDWKIENIWWKLDETNNKINSIDVYNDSEIKKDLWEQKTQLKQANLDIKKLEKQKADKEHKHVIDDIEWLPAFLNNIKTTWPVAVWGYTKWVRSIVAWTWITIDETDPRHPIINTTWWWGSWDVVWPAGATDWNIALYDWATGKLIKNSTYSPASFAPALTYDENYVTDAQLVVIGNTSWTNTWDQDLSVLVPYTWATADLNLWTYDVITDTLRASTSAWLLIESANGTDVWLLWAWNTANVTWYWNHNYSTATQDTIAIFTGAWKTLWSAATATYPSLNELAYVKWVTSAIQTQLNAKLGLSWGTVTWAIVLDENASLQLDWVLSADGKWSGTTITWTAWYTQAFGDLVYLDPTDSRREATDANAAAWADWDCRGLIGMVVSTWTDWTACTILLQWTIRADANFPTLTVGWPVFASETAWDVVTTAPSTSGAVVRVLGSALTADSMYFNPSGDFIVNV